MVELTRLPVIQPIPQPDRLIRIMKMNAMIAGGLAVWAAGFSPTYGDIDIYPANQNSMLDVIFELRESGVFTKQSYASVEFMVEYTPMQVVVPFSPSRSFDEILERTDMSISATRLRYDGRQFYVEALYPKDLFAKKCRILIEHEFTPYRAKLYEDRGFTIISPNN